MVDITIVDNLQCVTFQTSILTVTKSCARVLRDTSPRTSKPLSR